MAENELVVALKLVADQFQSELKKSESGLASFLGTTAGKLTALATAGTAVAGTILALAKSAADYGDELYKTSQKIGIQVDVLSGLQYAAKTTNISYEELTKGLKFLSQHIVENADAFSRLDISTRNADGSLVPTEEILLALAERFKGTADDAAKTALAVELFGKAGYNLIPFLNQGRDGIAALTAEAQRLGLVLTTEQAAAAAQFNDDLKRMQASSKGLAVTIGNELIPVFNQWLDILQRSSSGGGLFAQWLKGVTATMLLLGDAATRVLIAMETIGLFGRTEGHGAEMIGLADEDIEKRLSRLYGGGTGAPGVPGSAGPQKPSIGVALIQDQSALEEEWAYTVEQMKEHMADLTAASEEEAARHQAAWADAMTSAKAYLKQLEFVKEGEYLMWKAGVQEEVEAMEEKIQASKTFFSIYLDDLKKFVGDNETGFGLARQLAVQTAHLMASSFQQFFFNVMSGQFRSFKDLLHGVLTFAEQIISKIMADLVTTGLLKAGVPALQGFFAPSTPSSSINYGAGGELGIGVNTIPGFQSGGSFTVGGFGGPDSQLVAFNATPGENVKVGAAAEGGGDVSIVVNNYSNAEVSASSSQSGDGKKVIELLIKDSVKKGIFGGDFDKALNLNFGLTRQGAGH